MRPLASIAAAGALWVVSGLAFANAPLGSQIENVPLPALDGGEQMLLSDTNVSIFIFIHPGLAHSNQALIEIAQIARGMTNRPVHWCAIVSDRVPRETIAAEMNAIPPAIPVLIDRGDALFGKLGVVMRPCIGITDEHRTLVAYEHFTQVNYAAVVQAQLRHALKEISDDELAEAVHPPAATLNKTNSVAHRYYRLAEKQFAATNLAPALANIRHSLDQKSTPEAHALEIKILTALGRTHETNAIVPAAMASKTNSATTAKP